MITGSIPAHASSSTVLNRYSPKSVEVDDDAIEHALTVAPRWHIPNDYLAVREMQGRAEPLALADSPIARMIRKMAGEISGTAGDKDRSIPVGSLRLNRSFVLSPLFYCRRHRLP